MKHIYHVVALLIVTAFAHAERTLEHQAVIDAPIAEVWNAWTTNEGFTSWAVAKAEIDFRIGGDMRTSYNPQSNLNDEHTIINRIISYEPQRMLSIKNVQAPAAFKNAELFQSTWSVVYFEPRGDDQTHIRIVGMGYGEGPEWDAIYTMFQSGNQWTLDRLKEKFAGKENATSSVDDADHVMKLLASWVGGDWVHENINANGATFRARSRMEYGPEQRSIHGKGWLGDANGMSFHGNLQIWREPAPRRGETAGPIKFQNINESGHVARGEIHMGAEPNQLVWDWHAFDLNGSSVRYHVTTTLEDADHYRFVLNLADETGNPVRELVNIVYTRVQELPAAFAPTKSAH